MEFTLKVPTEHINVILAGLDELKHGVARRTIDMLLAQVQEQQRQHQLTNPEPGGQQLAN